MAVAELFIGAFITVLVEKLASGDLIRLARSAGIDSEQLEKWRNTLMQIQAVLVDAGQKHVKHESVEIWLNNLQHLAYEIDDVLDDLATEAARRRLSQESSPSSSKNTSKVLKFIPNKLHDFKYGLKMRSKLDGITTKLHDLIEQKNLLGLVVNVEVVNHRRPETTSLFDESEIVGREDDKEALLMKLLEGESSSSGGQTKNFKVVSIVGLGGIGKTTLAQLLYNDEKVKKHFEVMAWVCVSDEFDVSNISKAIFQSVGGGSQDFANLDLLHQALSERLSNKKFLIVLDDVWNKNNSQWRPLQELFNKGSPGSKVLVTTRNTEVAKVMDSVQAYPLEILSDEVALSLFARQASGEQNFDVNQILMLHGQDIIKKCGRLPLALRVLGRVFRTKDTYEEWEKLLKSDIWNLDNESEIPTALRLSYYDLPPHLKQIFAYCCLFPKDYVFEKDKLVLLWMGEGFLHHSNGEKTMEDLGGEYFKELLSRSFFQNNNSLELSKCTMHDLIHDLATSVGGDFFFMLDDKTDVYNMHVALEKVHHISSTGYEFGGDKMFKALQRGRRLRTFLPINPSWVRFYVSNNVLMELTHQLQYLRVLSLAHYNIEQVPQSIGSLKHLRYLNLSYTDITCLPEQVGKLHNLQILLFRYCLNLSSLPNSITKLINLRHLDIYYTPKLNKKPLGLGELASLKSISKIIIGGAYDEYEISDLKGPVHVRGDHLSFVGLHKVKDAGQAKEAKLDQKKGIYYLKMEWSDIFDDSRNGTIEYEVLEGLRPFEKLRRLEINYYSGTKFPSWVGDPAFDCLTKLTLYHCRNCTCLSTLGQLPSLQYLAIRDMYGLKRLGSEFLRPSNSCHHSVAFPSLEILRFEDMRGWEEWSTSDGDSAGAFPCLRIIAISKCPNLKSFPHKHLQSLTSVRHMEITYCPSMDYSFPCGSWPPNLSFLEIGCLKKPISEWGMQNFPTSLDELKLHGENSGVVSFAKAEEDTSSSSMLILPSSLISLTLLGFEELESLSEGLQHLTCLRKLYISRCPKLRYLPETIPFTFTF